MCTVANDICQFLCTSHYNYDNEQVLSLSNMSTTICQPPVVSINNSVLAFVTVTGTCLK